MQEAFDIQPLSPNQEDQGKCNLSACQSSAKASKSVSKKQRYQESVKGLCATLKIGMVWSGDQ
jgi:hypothetical protein